MYLAYASLTLVGVAHRTELIIVHKDLIVDIKAGPEPFLSSAACIFVISL